VQARLEATVERTRQDNKAFVETAIAAADDVSAAFEEAVSAGKIAFVDLFV
jgi:thiazole synthase ThiGH ThiG subunit